MSNPEHNRLMNRLIRGLPAEPEQTDETDVTDTAPQSGRDWFDRIVLGRKAAEPEPGGGDAA